MKPGAQQRTGGRGGLQSLGYAGCTGWDRKERDEACLCLFPPTHNMHRAVQEPESYTERVGLPPAPPGPDSSTPFSNPGERSSPKDEISLDLLTPESCQLALTPDPFWKVTRPEKRRLWVWKGQEVGAGWYSHSK